MYELLNVLKSEELIKLKLRALYQQCGYKHYRMSCFEEYRYYLENKNFLLSDSVITFTDLDGRLLALKPDVTLSIVKQCDGSEQKVYYIENVYRPDRNNRSFKEIEQIGLEHIGHINSNVISQVAGLAGKSLSLVAKDSLLEIGHCGFVGGLLKALEEPKSVADEISELISKKNVSDLRKLAEARGYNADTTRVIMEIPTLCGDFNTVLKRARDLCLNDDMYAAVNDLSDLSMALADDESLCALRVDLSLSGEEEYYNGVIFCGYVRGLPSRVLTGGRYDKLLEKQGKKCGALGFAIYFDEIEQLYHTDGGADRC